jgi:hypothetical protein
MSIAGRLTHGNTLSDLQWLVENLWPSDDVVTTIDTPLPTGHHLVEEYVVFPSSRRPVLLVPVIRRAGAVRGLTAHFQVRSRGPRATRGAAALALGLSGTDRARGGRLRVGVRRENAHSPPDLLLTRLAKQFDIPLVAIVAIGRQDPNRKSTLELLDPGGRPIGFAKVGWNAPTRVLVEQEAAVLQELQRNPVDQSLRVPSVLATLRWRHLNAVVTSPLPRGARRWPVRRMPSSDAMRAAAGVVDRSRSGAQRVTDLAIWTRQRASLRGVMDAGPEPQAAKRLLDVLERSITRAEDARATVGRWHGDWSPWNMATSRGGQLWVWDWEHWGRDVPLGFDALNFVFQVAVAVDGCSAAEAVARLRRDGPALLRDVGVAEAAVPALTVGYLVEMWLRACRLCEDGGHWNPIIHPGLVRALSASPGPFREPI